MRPWLLLAAVAESVVHQLAVGVATYLAYLQRHPADRNHPPGHGKFGFISGGINTPGILYSGATITWFPLAVTSCQD